ncbi:hypothetical protein [Shewanella aestuarii]|uniref:Uncharacterized protein n=1 Tax=Shewanella aestuarii TaxID=1028752 RepID=A0A6G9QMU3_9GAMM|nr:hypothetical protein [Shewanella aestuarii]QIR15141.1 hypothetical protein HBH39_12135 [Shewanella aestuarii]
MLLNDRWIQGAAISALLLSLIDFNQRYDVSSKNRDDKVIAQVELRTNYTPYTEEEIGKVMASFAKYDVPPKKQAQNKDKPKPKPKPNPKLSKEYQDKQSGSLEQVFIGDYAYSLLGVFDDGKQFALLEQRNVKNGQSKRLKVVNDQNIEKYRIEKIELNSVVLSVNERTIVLRLFEIKQKRNK